MKKRGKIGKKGISPLIATVIIVGFVIILAGLFYAFFSKEIKTQMDKTAAESEGKTKCLNVDVQATDCVSDGNYITLKNSGSQSVAGFAFRIKDNTDSYKTFVSQVSIAKGKEARYSPGKSIKLETGSEGDAIPLVAAAGYAYPCTDKKVTISC